MLNSYCPIWSLRFSRYS